MSRVLEGGGFRMWTTALLLTTSHTMLGVLLELGVPFDRSIDKTLTALFGLIAFAFIKV